MAPFYHVATIAGPGTHPISESAPSAFA